MNDKSQAFLSHSFCGLRIQECFCWAPWLRAFHKDAANVMATAALSLGSTRGGSDSKLTDVGRIQFRGPHLFCEALHRAEQPQQLASSE